MFRLGKDYVRYSIFVRQEEMDGKLVEILKRV